MDNPCKTCEKTEEEKITCLKEGWSAYCGKFQLWNMAISRVIKEVLHK